MDSFHAQMLDWYDKHARSLPWRISPRDGKRGIMPDPYHVWLSEVMLQQTSVASVKPYFKKFITQWPSISDLAEADTDNVMRAWAGLGYYSRARNLKACAEIIHNEFDGQLPQEIAQLKKLPGIGDYTSAAISAIAFGRQSEAVDGNIERVVTRFTANGTPLPKVKADCRAFMGQCTPVNRPGDFIQAMMDLGATVCTPKHPACGRCPVSRACRAARAGTMLDFPVKPAKKKKPVRRGAAYIVERDDGAILLVRRPEKGLLAGMVGLPTTNWTASQDGQTGPAAAPFEAGWQSHGEIRHTFTHFHLDLEVWHTISDQPLEDSWWSARAQISQEALPTVMKKAITTALPKIFIEEVDHKV